ncbi:hypothetical protein [Undibacterium sp.]|uniref:hypothetical protein n=1 Tax=Undibacterium sp. TaxID=1914977 RepID=UPI00374CD2D5
MATTPVKKVAAKTKAPVVPAKKIVAAAAKAPAAKAASTSAAKPAVAGKAVVKTVKKPVAAVKPVATKAVPAKPVAAKPAVSAAAAAAASKEKPRKAKLVRDSFTMPESEYEVLSQVKKACISAGVEVKKSQLLRIGLVLLKKTDVAALKNLIAGLEPLKAGRPKKEK